MDGLLWSMVIYFDRIRFMVEFALREDIDVLDFLTDLDELKYWSSQFENEIKVLIGDGVGWEKKVFGDWGLREMVIHFSAWAALTIESIEKVKNGEGEPVPVLEFDSDWREFNEREIAERVEMSGEEIHKEFLDLRERLYREYASVRGGETNEMLYEFVSWCVEMDVEHYREHSGEVSKVVTALE